MPISLNKSAHKRTSSTRPVMDAINEAILKKAAEEKRREYVGASGIAGSCERRVQYDYLATPYDDDFVENPRFVRIRERGHIVEDLAIGWLELAGFKFHRLPSGEQPRFFDADGDFSGGCDGIITDGPLDLQYPFLWEHKALGSKSWKWIDKRGLIKGKPIYAGQMGVYQGHLDLPNPGLFQATNCDTMEIYLEWVPFNQPLAQDLTDKAADIIADTKAGAWRPRVSTDPDYFECKFFPCPYRQRCHEKALEGRK
jgi:hypothetical protein